MIFLIIIISTTIIGLWYWNWSENKKEEKESEEKKRKKEKEIEDFFQSYNMKKRKVSFEKIKPLPLPFEFEADELIYYQKAHFNQFYCWGFPLYTILTNKKLILFNIDGIKTFNLDELSYFISYRGINIVPNNQCKRIVINEWSDILVKIETALKKFGVPYRFDEKQEEKEDVKFKKSSILERIEQSLFN